MHFTSLKFDLITSVYSSKFARLSCCSLVNTVCTFYELTEGDDTVGQPFHGLDREILVKSLRTLEKQHKAEIFETEDGVKFFTV